jgi:adenylylsulfate kinase
MRPIISNDLGFSDFDRAENIRRSALLANHLNEQGVFVIAAFITPLESHRCLAKHVLEDHYLEVFIDAPLSVCEQRDVKGLYKLARSGKLINFTGISSRFEPPQNPWLTIDTQQTPDACINRILTALKVEATSEHSHSLLSSFNPHHL